jgi:hypothetical protein
MTVLVGRASLLECASGGRLGSYRCLSGVEQEATAGPFTSPPLGSGSGRDDGVGWVDDGWLSFGAGGAVLQVVVTGGISSQPVAPQQQILRLPPPS